jgi:hypothetical protein
LINVPALFVIRKPDQYCHFGIAAGMTALDVDRNKSARRQPGRMFPAKLCGKPETPPGLRFGGLIPAYVEMCIKTSTARGNESKTVNFKASLELRHSNFMESKACFGRFKNGVTM